MWWREEGGGGTSAARASTRLAKSATSSSFSSLLDARYPLAPKMITALVFLTLVDVTSMCPGDDVFQAEIVFLRSSRRGNIRKRRRTSMRVTEVFVWLNFFCHSVFV